MRATTPSFRVRVSPGINGEGGIRTHGPHGEHTLSRRADSTALAPLPGVHALRSPGRIPVLPGIQIFLMLPTMPDSTPAITPETTPHTGAAPEISSALCRFHPKQIALSNRRVRWANLTKMTGRNNSKFTFTDPFVGIEWNHVAFEWSGGACMF